MSGQTVFRCLVAAGCVLAGAGVARASIPQSPPDKVVPDLGQDRLGNYFGNLPPLPVQGEVSKTITLNFGPLHFQEVVRTTPKTCRS